MVRKRIRKNKNPLKTIKRQNVYLYIHVFLLPYSNIIYSKTCLRHSPIIWARIIAS